MPTTEEQRATYVYGLQTVAKHFAGSSATTDELKYLGDEMKSLDEAHERFHASTAGSSADCTVTVSYSCSGGGAGGVRMVREPINSGPGRRPPIAWGGCSTYTVGSCTVTVCYECHRLQATQ